MSGLVRFIRCIAFRIELARGMRKRRKERRIRAVAAERGKQTELRRRVAACRAIFGEPA